MLLHRGKFHLDPFTITDAIVEKRVFNKFDSLKFGRRRDDHRIAPNLQNNGPANAGVSSVAVCGTEC